MDRTQRILEIVEQAAGMRSRAEVSRLGSEHWRALR